MRMRPHLMWYIDKASLSDCTQSNPAAVVSLLLIVEAYKSANIINLSGCSHPAFLSCSCFASHAFYSVLQVMGFVDRVAANNFMTLNPNKVTAAVHLDVTSAEAVGFTLQTNSTVSPAQWPHSMQPVDILICSCWPTSSSFDEADGSMRHACSKGFTATSLLHFVHLCLQPKFFKGKYQDSLTMFELPLQVATEREIARQQYSLAGQQPLSDWTVRLKGFPHPALSANSLVGQVIGPFLFAASMFSYVPVVGLFSCTLHAPLC